MIKRHTAIRDQFETHLTTLSVSNMQKLKLISNIIILLRRRGLDYSNKGSGYWYIAIYTLAVMKQTDCLRKNLLKAY